MADTKIEKELHIMNGLLKDIRYELRKLNNPQTPNINAYGICQDVPELASPYKIMKG